VKSGGHGAVTSGEQPKDNSQDIVARLAMSQVYLLHIYRTARKEEEQVSNVTALIAPQSALKIQFKSDKNTTSDKDTRRRWQGHNFNLFFS